MRCAIVDIGSNTIHMCIYEYRFFPKRTVRKIANRCEAIGLLSDISPEGELTASGIAKTSAALIHLRSVSKSYRCDRIHYFATAVLRCIQNRNEVLASIYERTGINVEVLSGENEAAFSFSGLQFTFGKRLRSGLMIDLGGGSTEILRFEKGVPIKSVSLPFGSLSLFRDFVSGPMPTARDMAAIGNYVRDAIQPHLPWIGNHTAVYAIGGTARTLCRLTRAMTPDAALESKELTLTMEQLQTLYRMIEHDDDMLILLQNVVPDRLNTISPGIVAYYTIARMMGIQRIIVSTGGIREGYLYKQILVPGGRESREGKECREDGESHNGTQKRSR